MRDEYNIRELNPSKNPYTSKVKVTIDVEGSTLDYFESMAAVDGIPYQTLINLYLRDCADNRRKIQMSWHNTTIILCEVRTENRPFKTWLLQKKG